MKNLFVTARKNVEEHNKAELEAAKQEIISYAQYTLGTYIDLASKEGKTQVEVYVPTRLDCGAVMRYVERGGFTTKYLSRNRIRVSW